MNRKPDFEAFLATLRKEPCARPALFEFIIDPHVALGEPCATEGKTRRTKQHIRSFTENGYDFATLDTSMINGVDFPKTNRSMGESISQNEGGVINDEASFEAYDWPDPDRAEYPRILELVKLLPAGSKFLPLWPCGVLENMTDLVGFETLCYLLADDPELVGRIADAIGSRLYRYYEHLLEYDCIGAVMLNDDWGHKTQTMFSPEQMRTFIFPWHKRIVELAHSAGRPAILHSCGNLRQVWEDIIEDMCFDAKHSYEDVIQPVEEAYEQYGGRIAILGGLDIDFLCRSEPDDVYRRAKEMLERTRERGGYALGSGNSITRYMPRENFLAMTRAVLE